MAFGWNSPGQLGGRDRIRTDSCSSRADNSTVRKRSRPDDDRRENDGRHLWSANSWLLSAKRTSAKRQTLSARVQLAALFDVGTVEELKEEYGEELAEAGIDDVAGCADETYLAEKGAKKDLYEEHMERKQEGKNPRPHPEGSTVAFGYLPQLDCFASVQCRNTAFASVPANALGMPMEGVAYCVTDDEDCYNDTFPGRVNCLFHRLCTRARDDERVDQLHEEGRYEELQAYLEAEYETLYEQEVAELKEEYPSFWDEETGEFTEPVTTNAIEGGNWRMKEKLGVPYRRCRSARGRVLLGAVSDSLSVYRNGRPDVSFAERHGTFCFEKIMAKLHRGHQIARQHRQLRRCQ